MCVCVVSLLVLDLKNTQYEIFFIYKRGKLRISVFNFFVKPKCYKNFFNSLSLNSNLKTLDIFLILPLLVSNQNNFQIKNFHNFYFKYLVCLCLIDVECKFK